MTFQGLINSRLGIGFVLALGRLIPPKSGYRLGEWMARLIVSLKKNPMVRAVRANQWVVSGQTLNANQLDEITLRTFQHTAYCLYDLYHYIHYPEEILRIVTLTEKLKRTLEDRLSRKRGTIVVAPHMSNFDLAGRAMALHGYPIQVLSYPQPPGGYQWQNKMRQDYGIDITPMSIASLRIAKERLKKSGLVLTGMDRPLEKSNYHPKFFGYSTTVPVTYISLASMTRSDLIVVSCLGNKQGSYIVDCSDPIDISPNEDKNVEFVNNAEKALRGAERFILQAPYQWSMYYPLWPWALEKMP